MNKKILESEPNPTLVTLSDNKAKWNLPEYRRKGYRDLHRINRYGLLFRSDAVLKLKQNINPNIEKIPLVQKMVNHKSFCSLIVGRDQNILFERYADDFSEFQPQTIMSITKLFLNLFIGELVEQKAVELDKTIGFFPYCYQVHDSFEGNKGLYETMGYSRKICSFYFKSITKIPN